MGVTGLWNLIGPCGKPVPVETLENKILAVDISIWLHQVVKGFQDNKGAALNNAHLLGLFHRLCKLLHYRIKPIFIFDGKVPQLKRDTIAKRSANRNKILSEAERIQNLLLQNLANEKIVQTALGASASELLKISSSPTKSQKAKKKQEEDDDMFKLPEVPEDPSSSREWETETEEDETETDTSIEDLQAIDVTSKHFKSLPADVRLDILTDIKEARKQSSWGRLHELPAQSDDFSSFQMKRLLKRRQVQVTLEETEQEVGGLNNLSYDQIQNIFSQSDNFDFEKLATNQIASDENVRFLYIKNLKKTLGSEGKEEALSSEEKVKEEVKEEKEDEFETDLKKAIAMSLEDTKDPVYCQEDYEDDSVKLNKNQKKIFKNATKLARGFMIEYGGMNDADIDELLQEDEEIEQSMMFSFNQEIHCQPSTSKACLQEIEESSKIVEISKDDESDSDDFVEIPESQEKKIDIVIDTFKNFDKDDDLFADIFTGESKEKVSDSDSDDDFIEIPDSQQIKESDDEIPESQEREQNKFSESQDVVIPESQGSSKSDVQEISEGSSKKNSPESSSLEIVVDNNSELVDQNESIEIIDSQEMNCSNPPLEDPSSKTVDQNEPIEIIDSQEMDCSKPSLEDPSLKTVAQNESIEIIDSQEVDCSKPPIEEPSSKTVDQNESIEIKDSQETIGSEVSEPLPSLEEALAEMEKKVAPPKTPSKEDILKKLQKEISSIKNINVSKTSIDDYLESTKPPKIEEVIEILDGEDLKPKPSPKTPLKSNSKSNSNSPSIKDYFEVQYKIKRTPDKPEEEQVTPKRNRKAFKTPSPSPRKSLFPEKKTELANIAEELEQKRKDLEAERNRKDRMGTSISERMQKECMQLLSLFGIPYIVAPTEAEAQCAYLNMKKFTHGTITDDSDIWLFGGQTVYKNFFMQHKNVMEFKIENIQNTFNVNRGKLIQLAMLVGSDYSTGINGIGAVTALEILATFSVGDRNISKPGDSTKSSDEMILASLERFREWWRGKGPSPSTAKNTLKKKLKNIEIQDGFPNKCIIEAYLHPTVEQPSNKIEWGTPNLEAIEEFAKKFLGWTSKKTNETILPVLKRFNDKRVQSNIKNYFETQKVVQNRQTQMSKRVKKAVDRLANDGKESEEEVEKSKKKRTRVIKKKEQDDDGASKPKVVRKRKTKAADPESSKQKPKVRRKKAEDRASPEKRKAPFVEKDEIPQKKAHEEQIQKDREKAAEILRNVKGRK